MVEKTARLNIDLLFSSVRNGLRTPRTNDKMPETGPCANELAITSPKHEVLHHLCIAVLNKDGKYGHCEFNEGRCPHGKYTPHKKIGS